MNTIQIDYNSLKKASWNEQEKQNVKLIIDFIQNLMNNHEFSYVAEQIDGSAYRQHNRNIPDGMSSLIDYVKGFVKRYPDYCYDVKHIYADGEYVIFHSHATLKAKHRGTDSKGLNIMDVWQVKEGRINDHWDALQPMDRSMRLFNLFNGGKVRNNNGVY